MRLIDKPDEKLTRNERKIKGMAEAMIKGGLSVDLYLASLEAFSAYHEVSEKAKPDIPPFREPTNATKKTELKFCIYCGTKIYEDKQFCIGCGKPYPNN